MERRRINQVTSTPRLMWCGIDPGQLGGIALISSGSKPTVLYTKMPDSDLDLWTWMRCHIDPMVTTVFIEAVTSSPQMGVSSAFEFGYGLGRLHLALVALRVIYTPIRPQVWQRALSIPATRKPEARDAINAKGQPRSTGAIKAKLQSEHKEIIRQRAQQLLPKLDLWSKTKTEQLCVCDSLLLALYGKMTNGVR